MNKQILDLIESNNSIVICGHIYPDGDCYGSQVALKHSLELKYPEKEIKIVGSGLPSFFDMLIPMDEVDEDFFKKSLVIIVDTNCVDRVETPLARLGKCFLKFDHHVDTGDFTEGPSIVDETANSTCDLLITFLLDNNLPIDSVVANALLLGIITDSGRFQFVKRFEETFSRSAMLVSKGANVALINKKLNVVTEKELKVKSYILSRYHKTKNGVLYIIYDHFTLKKYGVSADYVSNYVNVFGNVEGSPIWALFAEEENGQGRVEVRSNGPEVQPIMVKFGGGGHMQAAGATLSSFSWKQIKNVLDELDEAIIKWRN